MSRNNYYSLSHKTSMEIYEDELIVITDQGNNSGLGRRTFEMIRILKPVFPNIKVLSLNYSGNHLDGSTKVAQYQTGNIFNIPVVKFKNIRHIKKNKILDNKNLHLMGSDYRLTTISQNMVITLHEYYYVFRNILRAPSFTEKFKEISYDIGEIQVKRYARFAKEVISVSETAHDQILRSIGINSTVIYTTVDKSIFHWRNKEYARKILSLPLDKKIILNVSGGGGNKNLKVIDSISNKLPKDVLIVKVGYPIKNHKIMNVNNVNEKNYPLYFNAADLYLHTSSNEGFGIPLLEAISSGLPIVSSSIPTSVEILGSSNGPLIREKNDPIAYIEDIALKLDEDANREFSERSLIRSNIISSDDKARAKYVDVHKRAYNL